MNYNCLRRWVASLFLLAPGACLLLAAPGDSPLTTALPPAGGTNLSLSVTTPTKLAAWQQRLTFGPGDVLDFALFNMPDAARPEVAVGPDGRVSFL